MYPAIVGSAHTLANLLAKATLSRAILSDLAITQARSLDRESEPVRRLSQSYVSTIQFQRSYHRTPNGIWDMDHLQIMIHTLGYMQYKFPDSRGKPRRGVACSWLVPGLGSSLASASCLLAPALSTPAPLISRSSFHGKEGPSARGRSIGWLTESLHPASRASRWVSWYSILASFFSVRGS